MCNLVLLTVYTVVITIITAVIVTKVNAPKFSNGISMDQMHHYYHGSLIALLNSLQYNEQTGHYNAKIVLNADDHLTLKEFAAAPYQSLNRWNEMSGVLGRMYVKPDRREDFANEFLRVVSHESFFAFLLVVSWFKLSRLQLMCILSSLLLLFSIHRGDIHKRLREENKLFGMCDVKGMNLFEIARYKLGYQTNCDLSEKVFSSKVILQIQCDELKQMFAFITGDTSFKINVYHFLFFCAGYYVMGLYVVKFLNWKKNEDNKHGMLTMSST